MVGGGGRVFLFYFRMNFLPAQSTFQHHDTGIELALGFPLFRSRTSGVLRDLTICPEIPQEASQRAHPCAPSD